MTLRQSLVGRAIKVSFKVPLRAVLVVPFVLQIFAAVGLTGWLSLRNGQQAVNEVTRQLRKEVSDHIQERLQHYLEIPHLLNQINTNAIQLDQLNLQDTSSLSRHFWKQKDLFDLVTVSGIYFGSTQGEFVGLGFQDNATWQISRAGKSTDGKFLSYASDSQGHLTTLLQIGKKYDPRLRPWYIEAVQAGKPTWSEIYTDFKDPRLTITLGQPVYNKAGVLRGVVGVDFVLSEIGEFLQRLRIGKSGETFIIERSGWLVATSTPQKPFIINKGTVQRIRATDVDSYLIRSTAQYLTQQFGDLNQIKSNQQLDFWIQSQRQFLQVVPFSDGQKLDWLIVVVVPEADFMERINANTRTTLLLCFAALAIASWIGILTSRWISQPILQLSHAAAALSKGEWSQIVVNPPANEVGVLAQAFNQMALQLQRSFAALEKANAELETRVEERTALLKEANHQLQDEILERKQAEEALRVSEEKFSKAFRLSPDFITITTLKDGRYIEVNESFLRALGYSREEVIGRTSTQLGIWTKEQDRAKMNQLLQEKGAISSLEFEFRRKSGEPLVALLSAEIINLGDQPCLLAKTTDITERKQAENALQKSEASYRELALREELLNRLATQIRNSLELDMILDTAVHQIRNLLQTDSCHFMWFRPDPEQPYWEIVKEAKNPDLPSFLGRYPVRYLAASPEQFIEQLFRMITRVTDDVSRLEDSMERQFLLSLGYTAFLGNPIRIRSGAIGVLYCGHCSGSRSWSQSEVELVQAVADQLAIAISQAELYEQARNAQEQSDRLLLNILPQAIAERLKQQQQIIADSFDEVTVLFADIVDFTQLSARISPSELVKRLNEIFSTFDRLTQHHGLEKIKTIGDAYMVVGGLPTPRPDHAEAIAQMALDMQQEIHRFKRDDGESFVIRIGINSGSVVAGVIGLNKFIYDLWGDTVNIASRMESQGIPGCIQVTTATYERLSGKFIFEERGVLHVKGKGEMNTYFLKGRKTSTI